MKITRRKILLVVWFVSLVLAGILVNIASGNAEYGWATSLAILGISLGVPLMRAMTEFSK